MKKIYFVFLLLCLVFILPKEGNGQDVYSFTNCGAEGIAGPTQGQVDASYSGTLLDGMVTVNAGIQQWTAPYTATYIIEAAGASGGYTPGAIGGRGRIITTEVTLQAGDVIHILVGQEGGRADFISSNTGYAGGGGGGTFIVNQTTGNPVLICGGGGGAGEGTGYYVVTIPGVDASAYSDTDGGAGLGFAGSWNPPSPGGTGGLGGTASGSNGAGGGGYLGDGQTGYYAGDPGRGYNNGGAGGINKMYSGTLTQNIPGGFGGGAGAGMHQNYEANGGGAGGYSGGGASATRVGAGGGGGNYYTGTYVSSDLNTGHGYATITLIRACLDDIVQDNDPGECGAVVTYSQPSLWATATVTQIDTSGFTSGDFFPVDTTVQAYRVDYGGGDIDTCVFDVIVNDVEAPVIMCLGDTTITADSGATTVLVNYPMPAIYDNCSPIINGSFETGDYTGWTLSCTNPDYGTFGVLTQGQTVAFGDSIFDYFTNMNKYQTSEGLPITVSSTDGNFVAALLVNGPATHRMYQDVTLPLGIKNINIDMQYKSHIAFDPSNQFVAVYVRDVTTDVILETLFKTLPGDPTEIPMTTFTFDISAYAGQTVRLELVYAQIQNYYFDVIFDNIRTDQIKLEQIAGLPSGSDFPIGTTTNTFKVTDGSGNESTCSFDVTVVGDVTAPDVACRPITVELARVGEYKLTEDDIAFITQGTTDDVTAYEDLKITVDPAVFNCDLVGEAKLVVTVEDEAGNIGECETMVTVINKFPIQPFPVEDIEITLEEGVCETKVKKYPYLGALGPCVTFTQLEGLGPKALFPIGTTTEVWQASNTSGDTAIVSFTVTVLTNGTPPTIASIADTATSEDMPLSILLTGIGSGSGCNADELMLEAKQYDETLLEDVTIAYTAGADSAVLTVIPRENQSGSTDITVQVTDGEGLMTTSTFTLTVAATNDAPTAFHDAYTYDEGSSNDETTSVLANDTDSDGDALTAVKVTDPVNGTLTLNADGTFTYVHDGSETTSDSFTYKANDGTDDGNEATVNITIMPVNDPPVLVQPLTDVSVNAEDTLDVSISKLLGAIFDDVDDNTLVFSAAFEDGTVPDWLVATDDPDVYTLLMTPLEADTGCYNVIVTATDLAGATATDTFEFCVEEVLVGIANASWGQFEVNMYPNPTSGMVNIDLTSDYRDVEVTIMNIAGSEVFRKNYRSNEMIRVDMSDQVSGVYLVRVLSGDKQDIKKLILNRK